MKLNFDLKVFPNPINNVLNINIVDLKEGCSLYLLDSIGRLVWSTRIEQNFEMYYLDLDKLSIANGTYQVVVNSDNYYGSKNLIIIT